MDKIKILFDACILGECDSLTGNRSGIFFTVLNILKEFQKMDNVEIAIFCSKPIISARLQTALEKYFPENNFEEFYLNILTPLEHKKSLLKHKYKLKKNILTKLKMLIISVLLKILPKKKLNYEKLLSNYDIYFSPVYKMPDEVFNVKSIKKVTMLYDTIPLICPEYFNYKSFPKSWFGMLTKQLNENDYYLSISEYTKQDFLKFFPQIPPEHITTTLLACSENFKPQKEKTLQALKKYNLPTDKKYIFSLCTLEPRKNLIRAAKCFIEFIKKNKINDMVFILGGGSWKGFMERMENEIPDFDKYRDKILKAGYIDDEDLAPLYSGAEWFVYTSQYEGFGLPPLEAMSCGCPVITSNNSSLPEVVGDAGIMIDYDSDEQHIQAYEKYYFNENIRNEYAQKGLERAKEFSWSKCVKIMTKTFKTLTASELSTNGGGLSYRNNLPIVFICDDKYAMPTGVAMQSIIANKNKSTKLEINIIANNISEENLNKLKGISAKNMILNIIESKNKYENIGINHEYVSKTAMLKFDLPEILKKYDKILYLDSDVLVMNDLTNFYNTDLENSYAAVVKDMLAMEDNKDNIHLGLNNYFNSGVMLLNLKKLREDKISDKLIQAKIEDKRKCYMDQDAFNIVFADRVKFMPPEFNYMKRTEHFFSKKRIRKFYGVSRLVKPQILHLTFKKPWDYTNVPDAGLWMKYFKKSAFKKQKLQRTKYLASHFVLKLFFIKIKIKRKPKFKGLSYINKNEKNKEIKEFLNGNNGKNRQTEIPVIISMTSYSQRLYDIHYAIFSLLNQTVKPEKIILWLGEEQFPNKEKDLPDTLTPFLYKGLTIEWCKDIKVYTKLMYALKKYPDKAIVTADDDICYPENWLELLYNSYTKNPENIHCHRAHKILEDANGKILPYNKWQQSTSTSVSYNNFLTGVGGVLYPPNSLDKEVFSGNHLQLTPRNDDIWYWAMAVKNGTQIKVIENNISKLTYVNPERELGLNGETTLGTANVRGNENDKQLQKVLNFYPEIKDKLTRSKNEISGI